MRRSKRAYYVRFEKSLCVSLLFFVIVFTVSKHYSSFDMSGSLSVKKVEIVVEELPPVTRKQKRVEVPQLPRVPVPSEAEYLPDDETIEDTDFKEADDIPTQGMGDFPELPDNVIFKKKSSAKKQVRSGYVKLLVFVNNFGQVDSVRVVENTTNSKKNEITAIRRAYSTRYLGKDRKRKKSKWIERVFNFGS